MSTAETSEGTGKSLGQSRDEELIIGKILMAMKTLAPLLCLVAFPLSAAEKKPTDSQPPAAPPVRAVELMNVTITSEPPDASIHVEQLPAGRTPAIVKLMPGEYRIKLTLAGCDTWERKVTVQQGQANTVAAELRPKIQPKGVEQKKPARESAVSPPVVSTNGGPPSAKAPMTAAAADMPEQLAGRIQTGEQQPLNVGPPTGTGPTWHQVKYEVVGSGSASLACSALLPCLASLTYRNASGGTEQATVQLPWSMTFSGTTGQVLYLSAQKQAPRRNRLCDEYVGTLRPFECTSSIAELETAEQAARAWVSGGAIVATMYVDGVASQKAESNADSGIATVSGRLP